MMDVVVQKTMFRAMISMMSLELGRTLLGGLNKLSMNATDDAT